MRKTGLIILMTAAALSMSACGRNEKPESTKPIQGRVKIIEPKTSAENEMSDYIAYKIVADPFQLAQLEAYMRQHDIKFRRA